MSPLPPVRDREYDRFGPWVLQISDEDPPPPLFEPHLVRSDRPLMSIKVPRKIARRDAEPGMDLYDYVVSLYETEMVVLERVEHDVRERTIAFGEIKHLSVHEELLHGRLHLGIPGQGCELPYNTVSNDVMARVTDLIRGRCQRGQTPAVELPPATPLDELSFYFERLLRDERTAGAGKRPLAAQPDVSLGTMESSRLRRLTIGLIDRRLLESLHLSDGRELRVIDRGRPIAYRWQTVYGRRETIIPLANITRVSWDESSRQGAPATLTVSTQGGDRSWGFTRDNASAPAYREWLERVATTRR